MKKIFILLVLAVSISVNAQQTVEVEVWSAKLEEGKANPVFKVDNSDTSKKIGWKNRIFIQPEITFQTIEGIGGAFNEIGGEALLSLPKKKQKELMNHLFSKEGAGFSFCRTAIGASDFGIDAYSYAEVPNDYDMEHFSIERDKKYVLPYLKQAFAINPNLTLFASPWSPPGWMKESGKMVGLQPEGNRIKTDVKTWDAYAKYFVKYVQAYANEGVRVDRICIQNENDADTKYPSCIFPAKEMVSFANVHMAPEFAKSNIDTKIFAGTFRASNKSDLMDFTQLKDTYRVEGVGIQYTEGRILADAREMIPNLKIFHTEGHCYNGKNSSEQAKHRLAEVAQYINNGSTTFSYWNMILNETTKSGWNWTQNSLVNIDRKNGLIQYNPDYNAMFIISKFIQPGDVRIVAFNRGNHHPIISVKSPDGIIKMLFQNEAEEDGVFEIVVGAESIKINALAQAITAVTLKHR
ncbi:MAG: glycoside hydrolase family 30 protein [Jejuia sp.]